MRDRSRRSEPRVLRVSTAIYQHRLAFVFHVHRPDEQHLATLLERAKYRNLCYEHWGGEAFTVEQPGFTTPAGVKDRYIEMVQSHGAMQLSMGAATIPGIVTATRKFVLRLTPDENGQPREPMEKSLMADGYTSNDGDCGQEGVDMCRP